MGTHPIFESDFDCLTDKIKLCQYLKWTENEITRDRTANNQWTRRNSFSVFRWKSSSMRRIAMIGLLTRTGPAYSALTGVPSIMARSTHQEPQRSTVAKNANRHGCFVGAGLLPIKAASWVECSVRYNELTGRWCKLSIPIVFLILCISVNRDNESKVIVRTDSKYVIGSLTEWYVKWQETAEPDGSWKKNKGRIERPNQKLIKTILCLMEKISV